MARWICVLWSLCALDVHAQEAEEPPPWESGEEAAPADASADAETPPPIDEESPPAEAPEEPEGEQSPIDARADVGLIFGGKIGGGLGVGDFGATPVFELELGYAPDLGDALGHALEIFVSGQYAQPGMDGTAEPDPRLPGGEAFSYEVDQQLLAIALGALFRIDVGSALLMPYAGLGGRVYLLDTEVKGEVAGEALGDTGETQADIGLVLLGGLEVFVGPGAFLAELSFGWVAIDGYVLRDAHASQLGLAVGYRVML